MHHFEHVVPTTGTHKQDLSNEAISILHKSQLAFDASPATWRSLASDIHTGMVNNTRFLKPTSEVVHGALSPSMPSRPVYTDPPTQRCGSAIRVALERASPLLAFSRQYSVATNSMKLRLISSGSEHGGMHHKYHLSCVPPVYRLIPSARLLRASTQR